MNGVIGTCLECDKFVWAQIDGDAPIPIFPDCECSSNRIKLLPELDKRIKEKLPLDLFFLEGRD